MKWRNEQDDGPSTQALDTVTVATLVVAVIYLALRFFGLF